MYRSVGIVTDYGLNGRGSIPYRVEIFVSFPLHPGGFWGPPSLQSDYYRGFFSRGEADHSVPSTAEVKNGGAVPSLSHMST
jgi:hypothetical protein